MPILKILMCPNLTDKVLDCLRKQGIYDVLDFVSVDVENLAKNSEIISYKELVAVRRLLLAQYSTFPVNGRDLYDDVMSTMAMLPTGCESIDRILDGGLYSCEITEIVGSAASGKTQICLSAAASVAAETEQCVMYYDTGGAFDVERIHGMLETRQLSKKVAEATFGRIRCCPVFDIFELLTQLESLKELLKEKPEKFYSSLKLVIVDCVASVVSPILGGQQTDGHGFMIHLSRALKSLASEYSMAILITNNIVHDAVNGTRPSLGRSWLSVPNTRLELKRPIPEGENKITPNVRQAVLVKSAKQKLNQTAEFTITDAGLKGS